jgi:site-specific recombinase XerD
MLSVIDRNTRRGKRDYAEFLLLTVLGLRGVDVVSMTFDSVDWRNGEIKIIQSKTGKSLALPLTTDVGEAMRDHILNARPSSAEQCIFLNANAPFGKLDASSIYSNYQNYRRKAGLPTPSPLHGIRRSIATNMIIQGSPATTVAQVLGHATIDSTKQYISLDSEHLSECALDFSGIQVGGGSL